MPGQCGARCTLLILPIRPGPMQGIVVVLGFCFVFLIFECLACMYVHAPCACSACRSQTALDPVELELHTVVNHHVGARNQT